MRVAVVGAGVSGLVVAHLLHRAHDVTVFEANDYAGGHTNTVRVDTPNETHQVDTGFIVFNDRNYPNFERLLERLGVGWQRSTMSFSVSDGMGDFEYSSASPSGLFAKRAHLADPVVSSHDRRSGSRSTAPRASCLAIVPRTSRLETGWSVIASRGRSSSG